MFTVFSAANISLVKKKKKIPLWFVKEDWKSEGKQWPDYN